MRGRRLKNYRKQMQVFKVNFGFREPYQVVCDAQILEDAWGMKIDLPGRLKGVLGGEVKMMTEPIVTQCCIRQLYNAKPKNEALITAAKNFERRRCGHHELEEPLDASECLASVVGQTNKNRVVVATQEAGTRSALRKVPGTPIVYISNSVVILEPISATTEAARNQEERAKFKAGIKGGRDAHAGGKRKRNEEDESADENGNSTQDQPDGSIEGQATGDTRPLQKKKKRSRGPKQPNPLSVKRAKKVVTQHPEKSRVTKTRSDPPVEDPSHDGEEGTKRKRKRKHKSKVEGGDVPAEQDTAES
ncbi:rRNA-processing protein UTP23 [Dendryphion nanum]|uniref:U three protein 23 n=1 Tax=Dendryphion nanum TaxID=256645 RepID=A0A9P9DRL7_9PLEO|nr:rRNA-processing protein UTP23 [Dendryphion nanum]